MISVFLKEQQAYKLEEFAAKLHCTSDKAASLLQRLQEYGLVKALGDKRSTDELNLLTEETGPWLPQRPSAYIFTFVGVAAVGGAVLKCFPKYLTEDSTLTARFKQVLKVLEKYSRSFEQRIGLSCDPEDSSSLNLLSVRLFLLRDYFEQGLYANYTEILEVNGAGEIAWERTINETYALISAGRPYYPELITRRRVSNDRDFIRRLHACILTICTRELSEAGLLELFDLEGVELSDECLEDFGSTEYILQRLNLEQNVQFNTRKLLLLKTLYAYVAESGLDAAEAEAAPLSLFGTRSFNLVWEKVCAEVLENKLHTPLNNLPLPRPLQDAWHGRGRERCRLIDLIEKPLWSGLPADGSAPFDAEARGTLIPDIVTLAGEGADLRFIIFDAKYYSLIWEPGRLEGAPGIASITKQYLYELAFRPFLRAQDISKVINCFLFPIAEGEAAGLNNAAAIGKGGRLPAAPEVVVKGLVKLKMFSKLGLADIKIRLVPAELMFRHYLNGTKLKPADLKL